MGNRWRDKRTGRFRKPLPHERNQFFETDTLSKGLANFSFKSGNEMADIAADFAQELVDYAQRNAPWSDRTGEARAGLTAEVELENETLDINLFHTVYYGLYLEVRWGGKYAIIIPTIEVMGPQLLDRLNNMFGEIVYYL